MRVKRLMQHDISLLAYHLPLDAHPHLGNNAQLGAKLGLIATGRCGKNDMVWLGGVAVEQTFTLSMFSKHVAHCLHRTPLTIGDPERLVRRVAWCTGAAQDYFEEAVPQQIDAFVTGEMQQDLIRIG